MRLGHEKVTTYEKSRYFFNFAGPDFGSSEFPEVGDGVPPKGLTFGCG